MTPKTLERQRTLDVLTATTQVRLVFNVLVRSSTPVRPSAWRAYSSEPLCACLLRVACYVLCVARLLTPRGIVTRTTTRVSTRCQRRTSSWPSSWSWPRQHLSRGGRQSARLWLSGCAAVRMSRRPLAWRPTRPSTPVRSQRRSRSRSPTLHAELVRANYQRLESGLHPVCLRWCAAPTSLVLERPRGPRLVLARSSLLRVRWPVVWPPWYVSHDFTAIVTCTDVCAPPLRFSRVDVGVPRLLSDFAGPCTASRVRPLVLELPPFAMAAAVRLMISAAL